MFLPKDSSSLFSISCFKPSISKPNCKSSWYSKLVIKSIILDLDFFFNWYIFLSVSFLILLYFLELSKFINNASPSKSEPIISDKDVGITTALPIPLPVVALASNTAVNWRPCDGILVAI